MRNKEYIVMIIVSLAVMGGVFCSFAEAELRFIDPMIGTGGSGHCFPGPCRPFGLVQPSPDTGNGSWRYCAGYADEDRSIRRFSQTHLSGTGQAGCGDVAFLPFVGDPGRLGYDSALPFDKSGEIARVGYYSVRFENGISVEIASGVRVAKYKVTIPEGVSGGVIFDLKWGLYREKPYLRLLNTACEVRKISERRLEGVNHSEVWGPRDVAYAIEFSRNPDRLFELPAVEASEGVQYAAFYENGGSVEISIALSTKSIVGARRNFAAESGLSFSELVSGSESAWADVLKRIDLKGLNEHDRKIAATCLYHLCVQPNVISDAGEANRYSTFSFWDTFRDAHPLYEKLFPEMIADFVNSLLMHYAEYGYLPQWDLWGRETLGMIGSHAVPVVVDAVLHGFKGIDVEKTFAAVKKALTDSGRPHAGLVYPRRTDWEVLDRYGYYPFDIIKRESVSRTLECCYDDFKAAQLARRLDKKADAEFFERRSWNFTNLFDKATGCFRPKDSKGKWLEDFNPAGLSAHYTEGSALQWSWYVLHRPEWMISAMGGIEPFEKRLDDFFAGALFPNCQRGSSQDITGLVGDYCHGNEPCHHIIDLYRLIGKENKTKALDDKILSELYSTDRDGICGNDDCGQMSAWYLVRKFKLKDK